MARRLKKSFRIHEKSSGLLDQIALGCGLMENLKVQRLISHPHRPYSTSVPTYRAKSNKLSLDVDLRVK